MTHKRTRRGGFTAVEICVAFALLAVALSAVAQLGYWSLRQRQDIEARQAALELATNVLETATSMTAEQLTQDWAAQQRLPAEFEPLLPLGKMEVRVATERFDSRRIDVDIFWRPDETGLAHKVHLTTLRAPRERDGKGSTP